jgi:transitional endoplasmic reticulum ATPase
LTKDFSFAYIQEAFVAALLIIASSKDHSSSERENDGNDDLDKFVLWREIKIQIKILRDEMDSKKDDSGA